MVVCFKDNQYAPLVKSYNTTLQFAHEGIDRRNFFFYFTTKKFVCSICKVTVWSEIKFHEGFLTTYKIRNLHFCVDVYFVESQEL